MDSIGSQHFNVPEAFCVVNVNQTTKHIEKNHFCWLTDLLDLIYTVKTAVLFYIWLFNFCTWILLDLAEEYKALFISFVYFF